MLPHSSRLPQSPSLHLGQLLGVLCLFFHILLRRLCLREYCCSDCPHDSWLHPPLQGLTGPLGRLLSGRGRVNFRFPVVPLELPALANVVVFVEGRRCAPPTHLTPPRQVDYSGALVFIVYLFAPFTLPSFKKTMDCPTHPSFSRSPPKPCFFLSFFFLIVFPRDFEEFLSPLLGRLPPSSRVLFLIHICSLIFGPTVDVVPFSPPPLNYTAAVPPELVCLPVVPLAFSGLLRDPPPFTRRAPPLRRGVLHL